MREETWYHQSQSGTTNAEEQSWASVVNRMGIDSLNGMYSERGVSGCVMLTTIESYATTPVSELREVR